MAEESVRDYLAKLGRKGAKARNANMPPAKRKKIAQKAAAARWAKSKKKSLPQGV
jgi:hypothetical protein